MIYNYLKISIYNILCFKFTLNKKDGAMQLFFTILATVIFQLGFCLFCVYHKHYKAE
jgi:hypothetical protein